MPYTYQYDGTNKRSKNRDSIDHDITNALDHNDLSHQPDADKRCDDRADKAERQAPADDGFCNQANNGRNDQVNDKVEAKRPDVMANSDGNAISKYRVHLYLLCSTSLFLFE